MFHHIGSIIIFVFFYICVTVGREIEEGLNVDELIEYYGYPSEKHYVTTDDGYTIEIQRIPFGRDTRRINGCDKRPIVFLMHGLFANSFTYVANLPSQSAAFIFADAGFDVWLGNGRGTKYGLNHTKYQPNDSQFWNYTIYEHSHYDLRQQIEYVLEQTGQESLFYIGHSQGTAIMFARLAESNENWQKKINIFFALGPTAGFLKPVIPLNLLEFDFIQRLIQFILDGRFGLSPVSVPSEVTSIISKICSQSIFNHLCSATVSITNGFEKMSQLNSTRIPIMISNFPDKTSTLNLLHWVQIFKYHQLQQLDLGIERNMMKYGQPTAPVFNISNIVTPTVLFFSKDDIVTDEVDVKDIIIKNMGPGLEEYHDLDHFTHIDFVLGLRANDEVYKPIIYRIYEKLAKNGCKL